MKAVAILTAMLASLAFGLTQAYSVEPVKPQWSGWTDTMPPNDRVSQIITCNWDEIDSSCYVELFAGERGAGGAYNLDIKDGNTLVAQQSGVTPGRSYSWLKFGNIEMEVGQSFTKGKQYEFRFTRAGADSIETGLDFL